MATQIIKKAEVKQPEYKVGETIYFRFQVPEQNIGWRWASNKAIIQKVNRVTVHALDDKGNLWKVEKSDILDK
jgi:hypothetical protein